MPYNKISVVAIATSSIFIGTNALAQSNYETTPKCNYAECDSVNIPVFIVDGIEMQNIDTIPTDDIVNIEIIHDPKLKQLWHKPKS